MARYVCVHVGLCTGAFVSDYGKELLRVRIGMGGVIG